MPGVAGKKILIIHFRVGRTDGVSLEISAWKQILTRLKAKVVLASGPVNIGADYVIKDLETQLDSSTFRLDEEAFGGLKKLTAKTLEKRFLQRQQRLVQEFSQLISKVKPDRVMVSNIFSVGENLSAAGALAKVLSTSKIPVLAIHHDFYWENPRYRHPSCQFVEQQLEEFFPPKNGWLTHACINSIARQQLARRKGIAAALIYDTLDFNAGNSDGNGACGRQLRDGGLNRGDLVVLQATRIVRRKNIELTMDLVKELQMRQSTHKKRVVLVMAGYAEKRDEAYLNLLMNYARKLNINVIRLNGIGNGMAMGGKNSCSLFGVYQYADIVAYPSQYEGFGNQFLEAIHAKKPVVVFEYPVFKADIKPLGFEVISLGDRLSFDNDTKLAKLPNQTISKAVDKIENILANKNLQERMVEKNFSLGKRHFSYEQTSKVLTSLLH